jgi:ppGpp synthetase/RelA/SpoT-type nucleotidyltranferase
MGSAPLPVVTPEDWGERYRAQRPLFEHLADRLHDLLQVLLDAAPIDIAALECRTKTVESFVGKLYRKAQKYGDPLNEVTDLVGVRVITYYIEDLDVVGELIADEFDVDWANSVNPAQSVEPDKFGYVAPSYVVRLSAARRALSEWSSYADSRAEIQVRTIAQHAWAAVDHKLRYKRGDDAPPELQRDLSRLSALFELADKEFSDIRTRMADITASYTERVGRGELQIDLNRDSLQSYLGAGDQAETLIRLATEAGWLFPTEDHFLAKEDYVERLLRAASASGFREIAQLAEFLSTQLARPWTVEALSVIHAKSVEHGYTPYAVPEDVLAVLLAYWGRTPNALDETNLHEAIRQGVADAIAAAPDEL